MNWNKGPSTSTGQSEIPLPLVTLYPPLGRPTMPVKPNELLYECDRGALFNLNGLIDQQNAQWMPVRPNELLHKCYCVAILNPYCHVDHEFAVWICNFCKKRCFFSEHKKLVKIRMLRTTIEEYQINSKTIESFPVPSFLYSILI